MSGTTTGGGIGPHTLTINHGGRASGGVQVHESIVRKMIDAIRADFPKLAEELEELLPGNDQTPTSA